MTTLTNFLRQFALLTALFFSFANLSAADAVSVKKVDFTTARLPGGGQADEWIEILIELQGGANESKNARNSRFNENIKLDFYLAYEVEPAPGAKKVGKTFYHFKSSVEISALEQGKTAEVQFFIPPEIKRLYELPTSRAFAHAVVITVDGTEVKPTATGDSLSSSVRTPERLASFKKSCDDNAAATKGVLLPIYETLFWNVSLDGGKRLKNVPSYRKPKDV